jgi:hypothetical protein
MRIAILLPGQPRFTEDFNLFLNNLKGYSQADWFVYISNNNTEIKSGVQIGDEWKHFEPSWAFEKIKSKLPANNYIQSFNISDVDQQSFPEITNLYQTDNSDRILKMFYNIYKADYYRQKFEEENNFKYDCVIRTRSDCGVDRELDLSTLDIQHNIIMPINGWHGIPHCCDMFGIGNSDNMKVYSNTFNKLKEYNDNGLHFHPESMLGHQLRTNSITTAVGPFKISVRILPLIN